MGLHYNDDSRAEVQTDPVKRCKFLLSLVSGVIGDRDDRASAGLRHMDEVHRERKRTV